MSTDNADGPTRARSYTCHHFSIARPDGRASELLRAAADAVESLGRVHVLDAVLRSQVEREGVDQVISVYWVPDDDPDLTDTAAGKGTTRQKDQHERGGAA